MRRHPGHTARLWLRRRARQAAPAEIPVAARTVLAVIPAGFRDDGCSLILDGLAGISWRWACRIHDWRGCSRCHVPQLMSDEARIRADDELRRNILATVPLGWAAIPAVVWAGLTLVAGRGWYDTCWEHARGTSPRQQAAGLCRHDMPLPDWWARVTRFIPPAT